MKMYESPLNILETAIQSIMEQRENAIYAKIQDAFDVQVDKQELIRALQYDRDQYEKGYADGIAAAREELVCCKDCKHFDRLFKGEGAINKIGTCYLRKEEGIETAQSCNDYCSCGERRKEE